MASKSEVCGHLSFKLSELKPKTKIWLVESNHDYSVLGKIYWLGKWRCYIFQPFADFVWSADCLFQLADFIRNENLKRKEAK